MTPLDRARPRSPGPGRPGRSRARPEGGLLRRRLARGLGRAAARAELGDYRPTSPCAPSAPSARAARTRWISRAPSRPGSPRTRRLPGRLGGRAAGLSQLHAGRRLGARAGQQHRERRLGMARWPGRCRRVQVEFVSANPTGPLHIGTGRNAALGDSLARVLAPAGWQVQREYYYNDAGAQMEHLRTACGCATSRRSVAMPSWPRTTTRASTSWSWRRSSWSEHGEMFADCPSRARRRDRPPGRAAHHGLDRVRHGARARALSTTGSRRRA